MNLQEFVRLLRSRWLTVVLTTIITVLIAAAVTFATKPLYQGSTRLFVSTPAGASISDLYQGNRLSQDRVLSYTELIQGQTLAQRTVDKLNLDMTAGQLQAKVKATSTRDTVLINVSVLDESPIRARDIANALSDEFVIMVRELETSAPGARPDARVVVIQQASIPDQPVVPKKARNMTLGLLFGLILGVGLALLRDQLDNTVKTRETVEELTGVGIVGTILLDKDRRSKPAISFEKDNSGIAESFRKLRTNLQFLAVDNPPRVIVITSSAPSEGKTTTAINIALALAEAEKNVVVVDGDMRKPSLHKYLDLVGAVGFSSVLSGAAPLSEVLQQTKFPKLTVLAAGAIPPNPSELLGSLAAKKTLSELRAQFDYVIIDSAPLLAVTDGAILATNADGALLIAKFAETKREQLAHSAEILRDVGARLLGAVFTMIPTRGSGSYAYNYYYYSGYGDGTSAETVSLPQSQTVEAAEPWVEEPEGVQAMVDDHVTKREASPNS